MLCAAQQAPHLRQLRAQVLSCTPSGDHYQVVLDDTVLYPEGGGQPADHGWLGGVPVIDVQRAGDALVHTTTAPVPLGPVQVEVNWARRFDHMQQHSGQHLLTAVALTRFGWPTTAFHLGGAVCHIELDVPSLDVAQLQALEAAVAEEIRAARPLSVHLAERAELEALGVRSRGVPDHVTGPIRLIRIEGLDLNTCGGTHVDHTGQLEVVALLGTEAIRGGTRVYFVVGSRVRDLLRERGARESSLSATLSVPAGDLVPAAQAVVERQRQGDKQIRKLQAELAERLAAHLLQTPGPVVHLRHDADLAFLGAVAQAAQALDAERLLLLAGTDEGVFVVAGPPDRVNALRPAVLAAVDGRGGGRPGRLQGKGASVQRIGQALGG